MKRIMTAVVAAMMLTVTPAAADEGNGTIVQKSAHSVSKTMDRLEAALKSKGVTIFNRIDHAAGAQKIGAKLAPTQLLIFGNPKLGTPLMQSNPAAGLDLPLKALVWQDAKGDVWLSYNDPAFVTNRHTIKDKDAVAKKMSGILAKMTGGAVSP